MENSQASNQTQVWGLNATMPGNHPNNNTQTTGASPNTEKWHCVGHPSGRTQLTKIKPVISMPALGKVSSIQLFINSTACNTTLWATCL